MKKVMSGNFMESEIDIFLQLVSEKNPSHKLTRLDCERWVTAHESAEAAFPMYTACVEWRIQNKIDEMLTSPTSPRLEAQIKSEKAVILHENLRDESGRPIVVCDPTRHDKKTKLKHTVEHVVYCLECLSNIADKNNVRDMCVILNLDTFGISDMDYSIAKSGIKVLTNYYPERLGVLYVINTPKFFHACYKIIQKWINPRTRSKIHFVEGRIEMNEHVKNGTLPTEIFSKKYDDEELFEEIEVEPDDIATADVICETL